MSKSPQTDEREEGAPCREFVQRSGGVKPPGGLGSYHQSRRDRDGNLEDEISERQRQAMLRNLGLIPEAKDRYLGCRVKTERILGSRGG